MERVAKSTFLIKSFISCDKNKFNYWAYSKITIVCKNLTFHKKIILLIWNTQKNSFPLHFNLIIL
ncbi:MAG: hypothetical protein EAZ85_14145 [Bacteroidetes bacterium]|nr:MAG: hypothetical protein EAZ85_14145 [Bacteroidota bacterium]